jgi:transcriptional regulator with XRE-family HTH domain
MPADAIPPDELQADFAKVLADLRERKYHTQASLAAAAGLSRPYVRDLEEGRKSPTLKTLALLSGALRVKPSMLLRQAEKRASERRERRFYA